MREEAGASPAAGGATTGERRLRRSAPWLLALVLVAAGFPLISDYGITWDEGLGDLFFGQRYLSFFLGFDHRYLDFKHNVYPSTFKPDLTASPFRAYPWQYYPVTDTLAAATSRILSNGLHVLDPFDGFHAVNLFLGALLLVVLYRAVERYESALTAFAAVSFLFLSPRVFGDFLSNTKDFPEAVFFTVSLLLFLRGWEEDQRTHSRWMSRWTLAAGIVWGLADGTKANAAFVPFIVLGFILCAPGRDKGRAIMQATLAGLLGIVVFVASWPYLWRDPIHGLYNHYRYLITRGLVTIGANTSSPLRMILWTTPPLFLLFIIVGLVASRRSLRSRPLRLIALVWIGVITARLTLLGTPNFDAVRHFLELFPALAIVAGVGVASLRGRAAAVTAGVVAVVLAVTVVMIHPLETAYWNVLIGGARGACASDVPQCGDYWGVSYRQGLDWINRNAPPGSLLVVPIAEQNVTLVAPYRLRPDVHLVSRYTYPFTPDQNPRRLAVMRAVAQRAPVFVMFILRKDWGNETTSYCTTQLRPAHEWTADHTPVMRVYRLQ